MRRARHNQCRRARVKNRDGVECPGLRLEKMNRNFGPAYLSPSNSRARARADLKFFLKRLRHRSISGRASRRPQNLGKICSDELRAHARQGWLDI